MYPGDTVLHVCCVAHESETPPLVYTGNKRRRLGADTVLHTQAEGMEGCSPWNTMANSVGL